MFRWVDFADNGLMKFFAFLLFFPFCWFMASGGATIVSLLAQEFVDAQDHTMFRLAGIVGGAIGALIALSSLWFTWRSWLVLLAILVLTYFISPPAFMEHYQQRMHQLGYY